MHTLKLIMASGWTDSETRALLGVWSEEKIQDQLNKVNKKKPIFDAIAAKLSEFGYMKTGEQCKTKIKNLLAKYRKVKTVTGQVAVVQTIPFPFLTRWTLCSEQELLLSHQS